MNQWEILRAIGLGSLFFALAPAAIRAQEPPADPGKFIAPDTEEAEKIPPMDSYDPSLQPIYDGWGIRLAVVPIKLGFRLPDYRSINRFNEALGIAPFDQQSVLTYGSEVGVYLGQNLLLSLATERGDIRKSTTSSTQYREISVEMERSEFRMEFLQHHERMEWSLGAFAGLGVVTLRSKSQTLDGGPSTSPIADLVANFLMAGPMASASYWVNPHLNFSCQFSYTASGQYNQPAPNSDETGLETRIRSLEYSDLSFGVATTVRF